jgi:hypothetical protein
MAAVTYPAPPPPPASGYAPSPRFVGYARPGREERRRRTALRVGIGGGAAIGVVALLALLLVPVPQTSVLSFDLYAAGSGNACGAARTAFSFVPGSSVVFHWSVSAGQVVRFAVVDPNGNPVYVEQAVAGSGQFVATAGGYTFDVLNCNGAPAAVSVTGGSTHTAPLL